MCEPIQLNGCKLSPRAIQIIADSQEDENEGFSKLESSLSLILVEMIQNGFGEDNRNEYLAVLADSIELIHSLKS